MGGARGRDGHDLDLIRRDGRHLPSLHLPVSRLSAGAKCRRTTTLGPRQFRFPPDRHTQETRRLTKLPCLGRLFPSCLPFPLHHSSLSSKGHQGPRISRWILHSFSSGQESSAGTLSFARPPSGPSGCLSLPRLGEESRLLLFGNPRALQRQQFTSSGRDSECI